MSMQNTASYARMVGVVLSLGLASHVVAAEPHAARIVAAGGMITETIYALGQQGRIVGIDSTSQFPPEALKQHRNVGYVRALSAEGILSLKPDLVLAIDSAGPPHVLGLMQQAGVRVQFLSDGTNEASVIERIRQVGAALGTNAAANELADAVHQDFIALAERRRQSAGEPRVLFILSLQNGRVLVGGRGSSAAAMIALAGGKNAAGAIEGYKPLSDEGIIAAAPDVILLMQQGDHTLKPDQVFNHPALGLTPAAQRKALVTMDGLLLLGFGPRTPKAAHMLLDALQRHVGEKVGTIIKPAYYPSVLP